MRSTFFGMEIARRALMAQQRAMDVASHNIANANNPAYSRQRASMVASAPYAPPGSEPAGQAGQAGTGVWVAAIERLRDGFLDQRMRQEGALLGYWQVHRDTLEQVERLVAEPSDQGLQAALDQFWQALQDLSTQPDSRAARELVVRRGELLAFSVRQLFERVQRLRLDLESAASLKVQQANQLARQVALLNGQIARVAASGQRPNDLLDERDQLLEQLAGLLGVQVHFRPVGDSGVADVVTVSLNGVALVDGERAYSLVLQGNPGEQVLRADIPAGPALLPGGEVGAYLELRGTAVDSTSASGFLGELLRDLDLLVRELGSRINELHRQGYPLSGSAPGDLPFFAAPPGQNVPSDADGDGWVADDLQVEPSLLSDPEQLAAALSPDSPGDGANALAMARIKFERLAGLGDATAGDFLASLVGRLGVRSQQAQTMADNQELVVQELRTLRESLSGVSLDEEMADLVRFEHAYGAAARVMTAMDSVLDTLIQRTGLVGRA